jgi:hypothetical protein
MRVSGKMIGEALNHMTAQIYEEWTRIGSETRLIELPARDLSTFPPFRISEPIMPGLDNSVKMSVFGEINPYQNARCLTVSPQKLVCGYGVKESDLINPPIWLKRDIDDKGEVSLLAFDLRLYIGYAIVPDVLVIWHAAV